MTTNKKEDLPQWAKNIKFLRKYNGDTQEKLGESIGYTDKAISAFENGRNKPNEETFKSIAKHYEVTLDMLLNEELTKEVMSRWSKTIDDTIKD